jgi:transposase, IS30 family
LEKKYKHLSLEERCSISHLYKEGKSIRQIAAIMDRKASTISREIKRNSTRHQGYKPAYAEEQARARRWTGSKMERDESLRNTVLAKLTLGWSPEQVSGYLRRRSNSIRISHESIYRFIDAQIKRTKDYSWRHYLPQAKSKRGFRRSKSGFSAQTIQDRVSIHERPPDAENRRTFGHWEADLMLFTKHGHVILVIHERASRLLVLYRQPNKAADPVAENLIGMLESLPKSLRRSITFDNGSEFAFHYKLANTLDVPTFFCDPHSPWQKGGIENAIGRMRRNLPRKTDLATISEEMLYTLVSNYNHIPRKCLGFKSPAEVFLPKLLHFKCDSTVPFPRE